MIIEYWVARNADGDINLFKNKPTIENVPGYALWEDTNVEGDAFTGYSIDEYLFSEITFENSPQKIKIEILNNV